MIVFISVKVSAGHADFPLAPLALPLGSSWTLVVIDLPRRAGVSITGGTISLVDVGGVTHAAQCAFNGKHLTATFNPSDFPADAGEVTGGGIVIKATGTDENGDAAEWTLGQGSVETFQLFRGKSGNNQDLLGFLFFSNQGGDIVIDCPVYPSQTGRCAPACSFPAG